MGVDPSSPAPGGRLAGKAALVTGAGSRGIGRAIALALAREGADVAVHHHSSGAGAAETATEIGRLGREAFTIAGDMRDVRQARGTVRRAIERFGRLDVLVTNAAAVTRTPFLEISDEEWDLVHSVNLRAYFACAQEAAREMVKRRSGRIIMVSSIGQQVATAEQAHYCASKGGVMQLAKTMALELAPLGVTVNILAPGTIETDLNRRLLEDPAFRKLRTDPIPMGRLGDPEDLTAAAVFMASDESAYMTGATIVVDGGRSLP